MSHALRSPPTLPERSPDEAREQTQAARGPRARSRLDSAVRVRVRGADWTLLYVRECAGPAGLCCRSCKASVAAGHQGQQWDSPRMQIEGYDPPPRKGKLRLACLGSRPRSFVRGTSGSQSAARTPSRGTERATDRCAWQLGHSLTSTLLLDQLLPGMGASSSCPAALLAALALLLLPAATWGQCLKPGQLDYAALLNETELEEFPPGATLFYKCRPGYFKRSFKLTCLESSAWLRQPDYTCKKKSCPVPPDIQYGRVEASSLELGSVISYSCDHGYRLMGESSAMCLISDKTLIWDKEPPICDRIPCGKPPDIDNGRITNVQSDIFLFGMVVIYECLKGQGRLKQFQMVGNKSIYCTSKDHRVGVWSGPAPLCILTNKCTPPDVENGLWEPQNKSLFDLGDTVQLQCQPGFELEGPRRVRCYPKNKWEPAPPKCLARCQRPPEIPKGRHTAAQQNRFTPGDQVSYICEPGYQLDGAASLRCTPQGVWSPTPPRCTEMPCAAFPGRLHHGKVHLPPGLQPGAKVSFECDEGYRLLGSSSRHCVLEGGQSLWNGSTPTCEQILCPPPPTISNGRHSGGSLGRFPYGEEVTYACNPHPNPHKTFDLIGKATIRCGSNSQGLGVWSPEPYCKPVDITEQSCAMPPGPLNGRVWTGSGTQVGSAVHYSCNKGYRLTGSSSAICILSGPRAIWDKATPRCEEILCPPPPTVHNGRHSGGSLGRFPYGKEVTYVCDPHPDPHMTFNLVGEATIRCSSSSQGLGVWSGPAPLCQPSGTPACPPPPKIPHGYLIGGNTTLYHPGMFINFSCDPGYIPVDGVFVYCTHKGTWSSAKHVCREVTCYLPHLVNGIWKGSTEQTVFHYGDNVTAQCDFGHTLESNPWSQCQANGTWAPPLALCMAGSWRTPLIGSLTAVIFFILLLITSCWISQRCRKGSSPSQTYEEVTINLHPQENNVSAQTLSLQPTQENTRCPGPAQETAE